MLARPFRFLHPALAALRVVPARGPARATLGEAAPRRTCPRPSSANRGAAVLPGTAEADHTVFRHYL
ncbi:hypothetical protein Q8W71_23450 [Methylobacterium sp. NEAU 140]|uniref:hypothetical protein n=1 Tax=Methylobacterium sp. NEAU 140 TaxID=3064945 RepID=UPI002735BCA2|nr:hypothetical protein [Methylobacterium sp. NEAU 140]MDP4025595.1 hypothetical protein [Methylobacterium sp. NEAU 140]